MTHSVPPRRSSDLRDPKSGASLAVDRRNARAMHRRRDRYLRRRSALLQALVETGLMPVDAKDARALAGCDPYDLRKRGLDERLERSDEHTSELQSLMRISYADF